MNSIEKPQQKHPNHPQKRSRHNSTSKQPIPQPLMPLKHPQAQPQPTPSPKQSPNQNKLYLHWIKQIYINKNQQEQLLKSSEEHADEIFNLRRNINKLEKIRDLLRERIKLGEKEVRGRGEGNYWDRDQEDQIVMDRTYFQESEDRGDAGGDYGNVYWV